MLTLAELVVERGATRGLHGIDLEVRDGEIVALIGANGAGKTTTLHAISALLPVRGGRITLDLGEGTTKRLDRMSPAEVVACGVVQCPEGRQLFASLTVLENLLLGAYRRDDREAVKRDLARMSALFPVLGERRNQSAGSLSGGEQMMLAIARALMARPRLLLLDEPSLGLAPQMVDRIFETILALNREGVTMLLVEQNALAALEIADRAYVLETGRIVQSGTGAALLDDPAVRAAYLGLGA